MAFCGSNSICKATLQFSKAGVQLVFCVGNRKHKIRVNLLLLLSCHLTELLQLGVKAVFNALNIGTEGKHLSVKALAKGFNVLTQLTVLGIDGSMGFFDGAQHFGLVFFQTILQIYRKI